MSRDAYWRNQRQNRKPNKATWNFTNCPHCGERCERFQINGPLFDPNPLRPHECPLEARSMTEHISAFLGLEEPLRDRHGRPMIVPVEGGPPVPYTRISTFAGALDDAGGLIKWKSRLAARGMAYYPDLAAMVAGLKFADTGDDEADKKANRGSNRTLDEHIETAITRLDHKAAWGTAIHSFTEPDPSPFVPERMAADVASYEQALRDYNLTCIESERFVVNDHLKVAGTFDGIWEHPRLGRLMGDKKTGKKKPGPVAVQLACYAGGMYYNADPVDRQPLDVRQDVALLFHIPKGAGKTEVFLVDLDAGKQAAKAAAWVREWQQRDDLLTYFNDLTIAGLRAAS